MLSQPKIPHDFQEKAIQSFFEYYRNPKNTGNPLIKVPTGGGKSIINAEIIKRVYDNYSQVRILCLTHTKEIIGQNAEELKNQAPYIKYGIYSSGLNQKCLDHNITFAGIQSVWNKHLHVGHQDLIMIDEAHLCPTKDNGRYRAFIGELIKINPKLRIFGLTATPWRLDNGSLISGPEKIFDSIIYEISILELIEKGKLSTITTPKDKLISADFTDLKINKINGDFTTSSADFAISKIVMPAMSQAISLAKDRKSWVVFCPSIRILEKVESLLNLNGISCRSITGDTNSKKRKNDIEDFKQYKFQALLTVDALTTGFNAQNIDCLIVLRPTQSSGLLVQILGRGMRIFPGKIDCLLLDYGGNLERHGPIDRIQPPPIKSSRKKKGEDEITIRPVKFCPRCEQESAPNVQACPFCNYEYPILKNIEEKASCAEVFSKKHEPLEPKVNFILKTRHKKEGMPDSVRVGYVCNNGKTYFDWLCPEHSSLARNKTMLYFYDLKLTPPNTVDECLAMKIPKPIKIRVDESGKYPQVLNRYYDEDSIGTSDEYEFGNTGRA